MKPRKLRFLFLASACLLLIGCPSLAKIQDVSVDGGATPDFEIKRAGKVIAAAEGDGLDSDDEILTGSGTSVVIEFNSGSVVLLRPGTHIRVRNPRIFEFIGEVLVQVEGAFGVDTEHVDAGAGSTEYAVRVGENQDVTVTVIEGVVNLRSKKAAWTPVRMTANQKRSVRSAGKRVDVEEYSPGEIERLKESFDRHFPRRMVQVTGMPFPEAQAMLRKLGIRVERQEIPTLDKRPEVVIAQGVRPGGKVWPGKPVRLEVAVEPPKVAVRNVVGQEGKAARKLLERDGFEVTTEMVRSPPPVRSDRTTRPPGEEHVAMPAPPPRVEPGHVLRQSVPPGAQLPIGSTIHLVIEMPPELDLVTVPNLFFKSEKYARDALARSGLVFGGKSGGNQRGANVGAILSQSPGAGERVPRGTAVRIVVQVIR